MIAAKKLLMAGGGLRWLAGTPPQSPSDLRGVRYFDNRFLAGGRNIVISSADGKAWTLESLPFSNYEIRTFIQQRSGARIVAICEDGRTAYREGNGWVASGNIGGTVYGAFIGVNANSGVAVGPAGAIYLTGNLATWGRANSGTAEDLFGAAHNSNGVYVVVGRSGTVLRSPNDGGSWVKMAFPSTADLYAVIYAGGRFVALGAGGLAAHSVDGQSWQIVSYPHPSGLISSVAWGANLFVSGGVNGQSASSPDAMLWKKMQSPVADREIRSIAYGAKRFVGVGSNLIMTAEWK